MRGFLRVWPGGHGQSFFLERLTESPVGCLTWQEHVPPGLTAKLIWPRWLPSGGALLFGADRPRGVRRQPNRSLPASPRPHRPPTRLLRRKGEVGLLAECRRRHADCDIRVSSSPLFVNPSTMMRNRIYEPITRCCDAKPNVAARTVDHARFQTERFPAVRR